MKRKTTPKKQETPEGDTKAALRVGGEGGKDVELKKLVIEEGETGKPTKVTYTLDARGALRLKLIMYSMNTENPEMREQLDELVKILDDHVEKISYGVEGGGSISYKADLHGKVIGEQMTEEQSKQKAQAKFQKLMNHPAVGLAVHELNGKQDEFLKRVQEVEKRAKAAETKAKKLQKQLERKSTGLHKQPRSYLKTVSKLVGKSTGEMTLFSLPEQSNTETSLPREVVSRNTAILGGHLLQLFQEGGGETLVIDNLSPLAELMGNTNHEVKIYLLYLGGYTYPIANKDKEGLTLTVEQLFKVQFKYSSEVADKYPDKKYPLVGTALASFLKNEPVERIEITPNKMFIEALRGKGLGNVLVVNDNFAKMALSLEADVAYKILTYSSSNQPKQKIGESNLVRHLGLEKQVKTQGKPRIRETILKGFKELQAKGHIRSYLYEEEKQMFTFTYSDKFIKFSEGKKGAKEAKPEEEKPVS